MDILLQALLKSTTMFPLSFKLEALAAIDGLVLALNRGLHNLRVHLDVLLE